MVEGLTDMIISSQRGSNIASKLDADYLPPLWGRKDFLGFSNANFLENPREGISRYPLSCDF
jgi:hypothetical protein